MCGHLCLNVFVCAVELLYTVYALCMCGDVVCVCASVVNSLPLSVLKRLEEVPHTS